jgi:hypothetical protein
MSFSRLMVSRKFFELRLAQAARGRSLNVLFSSMFRFLQVPKVRLPDDVRSFG